MDEQEHKTEIKRNPDGTFPIGNPGGPGRPAGSVSLKTLFKRKIEEVPVGQTKAYGIQLVEAMFNKAIADGDVAAAKLILSYVEGLPVQPIGNADGSPLQVQFTQFFNVPTSPKTVVPEVILDQSFNAPSSPEAGTDNTQPG